MAKILVTGTAGFIGYHLAKALLERGDTVVGLDNINDYYSVRLKLDRLRDTGISVPREKGGVKAAGNQKRASRAKTDQALATGAKTAGSTKTGASDGLTLIHSTKYPEYRFIRADLADRDAIMGLFKEEQFDYVIHLAAQAGVRYSLTHPQAYVDANITGFLNILEACRTYPVTHLVYASSSSVYGKNTEMPFSVNHNVDHPVSLYAASKKSNELMAHTYSHLFGIPATGLRFFTVYGPWGRPDMALFLFTKAILKNKPIEVFNEGDMMRDFTYIDDIVEGVIQVTDRPAKANPAWGGCTPDPATSDVPHRVYNIGNGSPVKLIDFISALEKALDKIAEKKLLPMQPGDVPATWADTGNLERNIGYTPDTPVEEGIAKFVEWYRGYYKV